MFVLRQGLFVATYHLDPAFSEDLHTLTGLNREDLDDLLQLIDDLEA